MDSVSSHSVATFPVLRRRHPDIFRKHPHEMRQVVEADRIANSDTRFGECFSSSRTIFKRYCVTNCEKVISLHNIIQLPRSVTVQLGFETRLHALVDEEKRMALRFGRIRKTPPDQMSSGAPEGCELRLHPSVRTSSIDNMCRGDPDVFFFLIQPGIETPANVPVCCKDTKNPPPANFGPIFSPKSPIALFL